MYTHISYTYIYIHVDTYVYMHIQISVNVYMYVYVCICTYVYAYTNIHMYVCLRTLQTATRINLTATPPVCKSQRSNSPNKVVDAFSNT